MTGPVTAIVAAHAESGATVCEALDVDPSEGLTDAEAQRRLDVFGPNRLEGRAGPTRFELLIDQFRDLLIWILVVAAAISGLLLGEWIEAGVILAIVVLNAALGYYQNARAADALAALREMVAPEATVVRGGAREKAPASDLVPGDVVVLEAGDRVPADVRLLHVTRLALDEAPLTGESVPVDKGVDSVPVDSAVGDRNSMAFMGTTVARGRGTAVVWGTGADTEMGRIAALMQATEDEQTPLQRRLAEVGRRLAFLALGVAVLIFVLGWVRDIELDEMFLTAVALAVAAIPEGLPAAVTITLATGMQRMARRNALVRRLPAVETLGAANVICTDKTGTLTRNELRVATVVLDGDRFDPSEPPAHDERLRDLARIASLCNDARQSADRFLGDPTEVALLRAVMDAGFEPEELHRAYPRLDELAFDSSRKRMSTLHPLPEGEGYLVALKGAPEALVGCSTMVATTSGAVPLDDKRREMFQRAVDELANQGLRTLALAQRVLRAEPGDLEDAEAHDLTLVAIVGMLDDLRDEARPAVEQAERAGIRVVMITGDHAATAATIGSRLGLSSDDRPVMSGAELRGLDVDSLRGRVSDVDVYARVDPADKVKIVQAWKEQGAITAMTGDGVNDAPALKAADIGIAMGSGTDVGKDASEMVLADDNFASIVRAVREGRRIFANLQKLVFFLLSANIAEILVVTFGLLLPGDLGTPLLATQILWINLITDGLPVLALAVDPEAKGVMEQPPYGARALLGRRDQVHMLARGLEIAFACIVVLAYAHWWRDYEWEQTRTLVFTALVTTQLAHTFAVRRRDADFQPMKPGRNPFLVWTVAASALLQVLVVITPAGHSLFDTVRVDPVDWLVLGVVTVVTGFLLAAPLPFVRHHDRSGVTSPQ